MICEYRCRDSCCLQGLQGPAVKDGPPRFTRFSVDHRTDLRMGEHVAPIGYTPSSPFVLRFLQEVTVQYFVQGKQSLPFCEISHLTQALKGGFLAENGSCHE